MSPLRGWVGPATRDPGTVTAPIHPTALHEAYGRQLADMLELVRSGEAFSEPATAERLSVRLVGVLTRLHEGHQVGCARTLCGRLIFGAGLTLRAGSGAPCLGCMAAGSALSTREEHPA